MKPSPQLGGVPARILGRNLPFAKLAQGGMADVFLARSIGGAGLSRVVVLKQLRTDKVSEADADLKRMFFEEARLTMQLNHPNIVHVYDVAEESSALYIVMEYAEGHTFLELRQALQTEGRALLPGLAARSACEVLAGLHYAHELKGIDGKPLGIVHRDVSPGNVIVGYDGRVQLIDFGVAKANLHEEHTEVGMLKGKIRYMSPEQLSASKTGASIDRRSDVFSFGVVLWELLTGERLLGTASELASAIELSNMDQVLPRVSTIRRVDPGLEEIVAKALAKRCEDRFQTAFEMKEALEHWLLSAAPIPRKLEDLGTLVSNTFVEPRERIQARIREELARSLPPSAQVRAMSRTDLDALALIAESEQGRDRSVSGTTRRPPALEDPTTHEPAPRRGRAGWLIAALLLGGSGVAALLANRDGTKSTIKVVASGTESVAAESPPPPATETSPTAATVVTPPSTGSPATTPNNVSVTASAKQAPRTQPQAVRPKNLPQPLPARSSAPPAEPEARPDTRGAGFLTLDTYPWTRVSLNGRVLGDTPIVKISLPPGQHTLTLENPEEKVRQTTTVTIKPGETVSRRLAF